MTQKKKTHPGLGHLGPGEHMVKAPVISVRRRTCVFETSTAKKRGFRFRDYHMRMLSPAASTAPELIQFSIK